MARSPKRTDASDDGQASVPAGSIDAILGGLENVVKELEAGDLPLERALERFEEGVRLARRGNQLLDAVEERVEMLLADREHPVPFSESEDSADEDPE